MKIAKLTSKDAPQAGVALAKAMMNDPLAGYFLPDPEDRKRLLPKHLAVLARYCILFGEAHAIGTSLESCAIWLPPGEAEITPERAEAAGMDQLAEVIGEQAVEKFFGVIEHMEGIHSEVVTDDHWYLQVIGVDPTLQKSGHGRALLSPIIRRADQTGHPCYLETFAQGTVGYYQKLGFDTVASGTEPSSGLAYWAMKREPE